MAVYRDKHGRYRWRCRVKNAYTGETARLSGSAPRALNTRKAAANDEKGCVERFCADPATLVPISPLLSDYIENEYRPWMASRKAPSTIDFRESHFGTHILSKLGHLRLDQITRAVIAKWVEELIAGAQLARGSGVSKKYRRRAARTIHHICSSLRGVLSHAVTSEVLNRVPPFPELPKIVDRKPNFLTFAEEKALYAAAANPEERLEFMVAVRLGLRASEQKALKWEHIDYERKAVLICRAYVRGVDKATKSYAEREVPLDEETLQAFKEAAHQRGPLVHCDEAGRHLKDGVLLDKLRAALKRGSIKKVRWHDLRHTFGSHLAIIGTRLYVISKLMGHKSINTTEIYAHLLPENGRDAVDSAAKVRAVI